MAEDYRQPEPLPFVVIIPTFDLYGYLPLISQVYQAAQALERPVFLAMPDRWGVWHALTEAVQMVERKFNIQTFRGLIVGSDTHISNPEVLAEYVKLADGGIGSIWKDNPNGQPFNFVANVHMRGNQLEGIEGGYTVDDETTQDLAVVHPKGYGLYYGWLSTRYKWHSDAFAEEGSRFMSDNGIEVKYAKRVKLLHYVRRFT